MKNLIIRQRFAVLARTTAVIAGIALLGACSESSTTDLGDHGAPTIVLTGDTSAVDTVLRMTATVSDNLGIKQVHIQSITPVVAAFDTVFTSSSTSASFTLGLAVPSTLPLGTAVTIVATAVDGAGNKSAPDTLKLTVGNLTPPTSVITSPASGTVVVQGKSLILSISGSSAVKVAGLGYVTSGSFVASDSTLLSSPLADSTSIIDTLKIPAGAPTGSLIVTPFVRDSLGQRALGTPITLSVQTVAGTTSPPAVDFGSTKRVEVTDTVHVEATDPNGIKYTGFEVRTSPNSSANPVVRDSTAFDGTLISVPSTFSLALPSNVFSNFTQPVPIYVRAFAQNSNGVRDYARLSNGAVREDTLYVVAGVTRGLPQGGSVADALYHAGRDQLFLTNPGTLTNPVSRLEVFNLADSSFKAGIPVGSGPWGITAWPGNHTGTMGDTLLVANSRGTNISYVRISPSLPYQEVNRYQLPNLVAYTVTTERDNNGILVEKRTIYDFSDRPQYVAATCKTLLSNACGDVILTYSTTPTPGQVTPFNQNNGTLRWENLTRTAIDYQKSHFFFEQAMGLEDGVTDTLEVVRYGNGAATTLVPANQTLGTRIVGTDTQVIGYSVVIRLKQLGFHDTTFVRNSGDFKRAVFGEGGYVTPDSRAMTYDVDAGYISTYLGLPIPIPVVDTGISLPFNISNFIANNAQRVTGVATNFDGSRYAIRGDSTFIIDHSLTLQGILSTTAANSGLDFHPSSTPGLGRLLFTASADANIEVWETCHFTRIATIPIRDPVVGPIKAAVRNVNGKLILFGVTSKGVVIVTLPNNYPATCTL